MLNEWIGLQYYSAKEVLIKFREIELSLRGAILDDRIRTLRTNKLKKHREGREAALFCFGLEAVLGTIVDFALCEHSDYDFVTRWVDVDTTIYTAVQLKEIVPDSINPDFTLQAAIDNLRKYVDSSDLVVALHFNKRGTFDLPAIKIPSLQVAELWCYGTLDQYQQDWFIYGDMLKDPGFFKYKYPYV
jgi:hypothetical protein